MEGGAMSYARDLMRRPMVWLVGTAAACALVLFAGCGDPPEQSAEPTLTTAVATSPADGTETLVVQTPTRAAVSPVPSVFMTLYGSAWIDTRQAPSGATIQAFIGTTVCGSDEVVHLADSVTAFFSIAIESEATTPGCGVEGAEVHLRLDGRLTESIWPWTPESVGPVDLIAGADFAQITGVLTLPDAKPNESIEMEALIGGVDCGIQLQGQGGVETEFFYYVVVLGEESRPRCGKPGSVIDLRPVLINESTGERITLTSPLPPIAWNTAGLVEQPNAQLTR
jgi:hypothetical protein